MFTNFPMREISPMPDPRDLAASPTRLNPTGRPKVGDCAPMPTPGSKPYGAGSA